MRQKAKFKYKDHIRLERASQEESNGTKKHHNMTESSSARKVKE